MYFRVLSTVLLNRSTILLTLLWKILVLQRLVLYSCDRLFMQWIKMLINAMNNQFSGSHFCHIVSRLSLYVCNYLKVSCKHLNPQMFQHVFPQNRDILLLTPVSLLMPIKINNSIFKIPQLFQSVFEGSAPSCSQSRFMHWLHLVIKSLVFFVKWNWIGWMFPPSFFPDT